MRSYVAGDYYIPCNFQVLTTNIILTNPTQVQDNLLPTNVKIGKIHIFAPSTRSK